LNRVTISFATLCASTESLFDDAGNTPTGMLTLPVSGRSLERIEISPTPMFVACVVT
jgi:hypothetical protein